MASADQEDKETVSTEEMSLCQQAGKQYMDSDYTGCLETLEKLGNSWGDDPRLLHCKALVEYAQSGYTCTDNYFKILSEVGLRLPSRSTYPIELNDADQSIYFFNHAVLLFHQQQYRSALKIMEALINLVDSMEENLSVDVVMFTMELLLITYQPTRVLSMMSRVESLISSKSKESQLYHAHTDIKHKMNVCKIRANLMLKILKPCKRDLKAVMGSSSQSANLIYLKANFEYLRGNYLKAIKILNSAPTSSQYLETGQCLPVMYHNNMAVIHFNMRKHHLGAFYLRRAFTENKTASQEVHRTQDMRSIMAQGVSQHYKLLYNMGVEMLHCRQPTTAFECLMEAVKVLHTNPRLWLRLAECCIMANKTDNTGDANISEKIKVIQSSVGSGIHCKLVLGTGVSQHSSNSFESVMVASTTLEFAALCLKNAMCLLPDLPNLPEESSDPKYESVKKELDEIIVKAPPSNPIKGFEVVNLKCSILTNTAYVALALSDFQLAISSCNMLLSMNRVPAPLRYAGHMYLAEALIQMDRIADAVVHFDLDTTADLSFADKPVDQEKMSDDGTDASTCHVNASWRPANVDEAKAILRYNMAVAVTLRGETTKAASLLQQCLDGMGDNIPAQVYFFQLYLHLIEGKKNEARFYIKKHLGHVTSSVNT